MKSILFMVLCLLLTACGVKSAPLPPLPVTPQETEIPPTPSPKPQTTERDSSS